MKLRNQIALTAMLQFFVCETYAANIMMGDFNIGINGYLDLETTYMSKMPMAMANGMVMNMDNSFSLDQNHMNLIFHAQRKKTGVAINLESRHSFSSFDGDTGIDSNSGNSVNGSSDEIGTFRIAEAYGQHKFNQFVNLKAGSLLAPFGVYNEIRYATPLFATVVLPFIYEMPANYSGTIMTPSNTNLALQGGFSKIINFDYSFFISAGKRNQNNSGLIRDRGRGQEPAKHKGFGGKVVLGSEDQNYQIGFSFFQGHPSKIQNGTTLADGGYKSKLIGYSLNLYLPWSFHLQSEYAIHKRPNGMSTYRPKESFYARLMYEGTSITPFIMYDQFKDPNDAIYKFKNNRLGVGAGYEVSENFILKAEYHYHWFSHPISGSMNTTAIKKQDMIRLSTIFYF